MSSKENASSKKANRTGQRLPNKGTFESSLRKYQSPSLDAKQRHNDGDITTNSADLNATTWNWKKDKTPILPKNKGFISTPATNCVTSLTCDASVIEPDQSCLPLIKESLCVKGKPKSNFSRAKTDSTILSNKKTLPVLVLPDDSRKKEKADDDLTNAEITILYSEYIQAVFLESKAKKSQLERDRAAFENLQKLWKANQVLMMHEKSLSGEVELIRSMNQLIEYCQKEESMLKPIVEVLPEIMGQYKEISDAVDTIRHKLYTPGVIVPTDPHFENDISDIVQHVKTSLVSVFNSLSCHDSRFTEVADLLTATERIMSDISYEVKRCLQLLLKTKSMTITETSLKIGKIQASSE